MDDDAKQGALGGLSAEEWAAAYAAHVREFPASRFVVGPVGENVRLAFGVLGPPLNDAGERGLPIFRVAVTMSLQDMVELRDLLVRLFPTEVIDDLPAAPKSNEQQ